MQRAMTELMYIFIGVCFLMLLIIIFIEMSLIYNRNTKENHKPKYHKLKTSSGVKWFKDEQLTPEVKAYKGFYSFSHTYLNLIYEKGDKKPSKHIIYVSGDDILKRGESGSEGLKSG